MQSYGISERSEGLYGVLGADRLASAGEIRRVYKRLALELHPDKNKAPGAAASYQRVKAANEVWYE